MSHDESFLARWSRRKREVAAQSDAEKKPSSAGATAKPVSPTSTETIPASALPPIKAIETASDLRAFLAPGVPPELTRAALRRAWTADPAIRDFIGLSENAWDFNAPAGVPGFGSLKLEDIQRLVGQVLDEPRETAPNPAAAARADETETRAEAVKAVPVAEPREAIAATRDKGEENKARDCRPRRHHGGALPQ
jgi:hypothetical protein